MLYPGCWYYLRGESGMFKEILSILRKEDLLKQAMKEVEVMLSKVEVMFRTAVDRVMEGKEPQIDIYEEDREVNRMEWEVRRKVLEHMIFSNKKQDVPAALILTSAVIDLERIGDYAKNTIELADICPKGTVIAERHASFFRFRNCIIHTNKLSHNWSTSALFL